MATPPPHQHTSTTHTRPIRTAPQPHRQPPHPYGTANHDGLRYRRHHRYRRDATMSARRLTYLSPKNLWIPGIDFAGGQIEC